MSKKRNRRKAFAGCAPSPSSPFQNVQISTIRAPLSEIESGPFDNVSAEIIMSIPEKQMLSRMQAPEPSLPYPLQELKASNGEILEEYIIPEDAKEGVLEQLYPFQERPKLDDDLLDIHENRTFRVRDFRVIRDHGYNFLVSPYYPKSGGTVLDWMPEE